MKRYSFLEESSKLLKESIVIKGENKQRIGSIWINGDERSYPHCHVLIDSFRCGEVCVCLHTNAYFIHGTRRNRFSNSKQTIEFDKIMRSPNEKDPKINVWTALVMWWNQVVSGSSNPNRCINLEKIKQPDYKYMTRTVQEK